MSRLPPPPDWLAPLQEAFGRTLRAPLDREGGVLRSRAAEDPRARADLADGSEAGLRLYHEQYWARLFGAMQGELPRVAQAVGYWRFNALAELHLQERSPDRPELGRCADGFAARLEAALDAAGPGARPDRRPAREAMPPDLPDAWVRALSASAAPVDLLRQAARMDEALRRAVAAPYLGVWRPTRADRARLPEARLRLAPSLRLLREDWAIAERGAPPAGEPPPFDPRDQPWFWACARGERTVALRRVEPGFVRLCALASRLPFGEALAALEAEAGAGAEAMAARVPRWIEEALAAGWWLGLV